MIRTIAVAIVASAALAMPSLAQTSVPDRPSAMAPAIAAPVPDLASQDECVKSAADLFQAAEQRQLAEERKDRLEELLVRMETYCEARQFREASALVPDIRAIIDAN